MMPTTKTESKNKKLVKKLVSKKNKVKRMGVKTPKVYKPTKLRAIDSISVPMGIRSRV